jgi:hypothetical protein
MFDIKVRPTRYCFSFNETDGIFHFLKKMIQKYSTKRNKIDKLNLTNGKIDRVILLKRIKDLTSKNSF